MPKVFNYTNRIAIPKECIISRSLVTEGDAIYLVLSWNFSTLELPEDSLVSTEIGAIGTFQTAFIDHGQLGDGILSETKFLVTEMRNPDLIKFRIKITRKNEHGIPLILAEIDKVSPVLTKGSENGSSLLKRRKLNNLMVPWELRFELGIPVLCISGQRELWFQLLKKAPWFDPIVLTSIVRTIFLWSLAEKSAPEDNEVFEQWKAYFISLGCSEDFYSRAFDSINQFGDEGNEVLEIYRIGVKDWE